LSLDGWVERCTRCGLAWPLEQERWICPCGGLLDLRGPVVDPMAVGPAPVDSMWRYRPALPVSGDVAGLGEATTTLRRLGPSLWVKQDYEMPTGSFKARGAAVMINLAAALGVRRVVADSSGNAGKAVAAYAAANGLSAEVFVPEGTATPRVASIESYGATVVEVPGGRQAAARAAQHRVGQGGVWYASHVYQPAFHHGVKTLAYEIYEQLAPTRPSTVVVPAGNGTLVLGLWLGFQDLLAAGRLRSMPRLVAVQAERCAPLAGLVPTGPTAATGIAIGEPPRAGQVRAAVLASGGWVATVTEAEIAGAQSALTDLGIEVEPTGAVAWAGWSARAESGLAGPGGEAVVVVATGR
jgi:threonine synthase